MATPWCSDGGDPRRKGRRRWPRFRLPRTDSFGVEEQHGEAVKMGSSICSGVASVTGDLKGTAAAMVDMELDLGFGVWSDTREREQWGKQRASWWSLSTRGSSALRAGRAGATATGRPPPRSLQEKEEGHLAHNPLAVLKF